MQGCDEVRGQRKNLRRRSAGLHRHDCPLCQKRNAQEARDRQADFEKQFIGRRRFVASGCIPIATTIVGALTGAATPVVLHRDSIHEADDSPDVLSQSRIWDRAGAAAAL